MKHLVRAAVAALVPLTAAAATLLPAGPAMAAPAPAPLPTTSLIGTWTNTNPATTNVQDIVVSAAPDGIVVDVFSACAPTACEWGNVPVVVFQEHNTAGVDPTIGSSFRAEWTFNSGHNRNIIVADLAYYNGVPILQVQEPHIFIPSRDGSGPAETQSDYTVGEVFKHATSPMTPTMSGTPIFDNYPMGNFNSSVDNLVGTWTNPANTGFTKVVLSRGPDNSLVVQAYAPCPSGMCDWGPTYAVTFAPSAVAVNATNFLAPYTFGSKHVLLCTALDPGAATITIHEFTDYTRGDTHADHAHSGTDSMIIETFTKVA